MNLELARFNMVEQQIRPWEVLDQDVLDLLYVVRREEFVPAEFRELAFSDTEVPLGDGERMWAPKIEARVLQALGARKSETAFEVGAGSGYFAALLAHCVHHVTSAEINPRLKAFADRIEAAGNRQRNRGRATPPGAGRGAHPTHHRDHGLRRRCCRSNFSISSVRGRLFAIVGDAPVMEARAWLPASDRVRIARSICSKSFAAQERRSPEPFHSEPGAAISPQQLQKG